MTKEDKDLLLKDLCARLPYHTHTKVWLKDGTTEEGALDLEHNYGDVLRGAFYYNEIVKIKPYLFPLSSMTEEQKQYLKNRFCSEWDGEPYDLWKYQIGIDDAMGLIDWFYKNHFDVNNLIPKGLAIDATGLNIY